MWWQGGEGYNDQIDACLSQLVPSKTLEDAEIVERHGIVYVSRVFPDSPLNKARDEILMGRAFEERNLHSSSQAIRLRAERVGEIDSLYYHEISSGPLSLAEGFVEIEVMAAGVNFRDVAALISLFGRIPHSGGPPIVGLSS